MRVTEIDFGNARDRAAFIRLPYTLYRDVPPYVFPLLHERRKFFAPDHPRFSYTEARFFLLRDLRGRVCGRVSAHIDRRRTGDGETNVGCFGFFECIPDPSAARLLLSAAEADLRARGMAHIQGPFNFSTNEEIGFLAQGFDRPPTFQMPYTPPYYIDFMSALGYRRIRRLLALEFDVGSCAFPPSLARLRDRLAARRGVSIRPIDRKRADRDLAALFELYNRIWAKNWGFVPMTEAEFRLAAAALKPLADPGLVLLAEKRGTPVGLGFGLPDFNEVLHKLRGRLFPVGWVRLLFRGKVRGARALLLGVTEEFRGSGLDILLFEQLIRHGRAAGYVRAEASWILEDNAAMLRPLERMGARVSKVYHMYGKALCACS